MIGRFKTAISRTVAATASAAIAALSAVRAAFAASTDLGLTPEYAELLRLGQEKVQAATQPGAFGNGTPLITDIMAVLPWIGAAACIAVGAVLAAKVITSRVRSGPLVAH